MVANSDKPAQALLKAYKNGINHLLVGDWNMTSIFPCIGNVIIPIDSYLSEGYTTNQSISWFRMLQPFTVCRCGMIDMIHRRVKKILSV